MPYNRCSNNANHSMSNHKKSSASDNAEEKTENYCTKFKFKLYNKGDKNLWADIVTVEL